MRTRKFDIFAFVLTFLVFLILAGLIYFAIINHSDMQTIKKQSVKNTEYLDRLEIDREVKNILFSTRQVRK